MRVVLHAERCQGHTRCNFVAPALFDIDERGNSVLLGDGICRDDATLALARRAVASCPESAIELEEE